MADITIMQTLITIGNDELVSIPQKRIIQYKKARVYGAGKEEMKMVQAFKKILVCTLATALTFGLAQSASASTKKVESTSMAVKPQTKKNVTAAKTGGVVSTVDTKASGTATIKSIKKTSKKSVTVPGKVKVNGVTYTVTTIAANTFKNCKKMTKVSIPASIKTISSKAFTGAKKLKSITLKSTKAITVKKGAFKGLNTKKMTIKVNKKMSKKQFKKLQKSLKKAGFKGKIKKA